MAEVPFGLDGINWGLESTLAKAAHSGERAAALGNSAQNQRPSYAFVSKEIRLQYIICIMHCFRLVGRCPQNFALDSETLKIWVSVCGSCGESVPTGWGHALAMSSPVLASRPAGIHLGLWTTGCNAYLSFSV